MANKMDAKYFEQMDDAKFYGFIMDMNQCVTAYAEMSQRLLDQFHKGESPSWRSLYLMRQVSIDVEKFGKMFREKTLDAENKKPFSWTSIYKKRSTNGQSKDVDSSGSSET